MSTCEGQSNYYKYVLKIKEKYDNYFNKKGISIEK